MNAGELSLRLREEEPNTVVIVRDPDSGLIHVAHDLIDEKAILNGHRDYRCGPHNLPYQSGEKTSGIIHLGQQTWHGKYPRPPYLETAGELLQELETRDPGRMVVITHFFDEFTEVDVVTMLENSGFPKLWGNPGSSLGALPGRDGNSMPKRALLIASSQNEAYSRLRRARDRELEARVDVLMSERPAYRGSNDVPIAGHRMEKETLRAKRRQADKELLEAEAEFAKNIMQE